MSFLFPKIPAPTPPPAVPAFEGPETQAARDRQRRALAGARGRESTLLTGPQGITAGAPVITKTLLGQ